MSKYLEYLEVSKDIKLSDNFTLEEVAKSDTAIAKNIFNIPEIKIIRNASLLIRNVLQPLRDHIQKPINVESFYRSVELNREIKGSKTSQHVYGQAVDIKISGIDYKDVVEYIRNNLEFDQLILEPTWIHVSFSRYKNRKEVLRFDGRRYYSY